MSGIGAQNVEFGSGSDDEKMDVLKVKTVIHPEQLEEEQVRL